MNHPRARSLQDVDGVLLLDKPVGPSSNSVLQHVKRLYAARRAGHTGTLDPLASGLLPVCFGEATKFGSQLLDADKGYVAEIRLGIRTETGDAEGRVLESRPVHVTSDQLAGVLESLCGDIEQVPPMYSALKSGGRPLYQLARRGLSVDRPARRINIRTMTLKTFEADTASVYVRCSKGTYIRTLAEDIGQRLGCGAHLGGLRRTEIADLDVSGTIPLDRLEQMSAGERLDHLLPVEHLVLDLPRIDLDGVSSRRFGHGQVIASGCFQQPCSVGLVRVYGPTDRFIGVADIDGQGRIIPRRLLAPGHPTADGARLK